MCQLQLVIDGIKIMKLDNSPLVIFLTTAALTTLVTDFSIALLVNIPVYLIAQIWFHMTKMRIIRERGYYNVFWKVEEALTATLPQGARPPKSETIISIFTMLGMLGMVYMFVHLTFLHSDQLWFLESIAFLGALLTIGIIWMIDIIVTVIGRIIYS